MCKLCTLECDAPTSDHNKVLLVSPHLHLTPRPRLGPRLSCCRLSLQDTGYAALCISGGCRYHDALKVVIRATALFTYLYYFNIYRI